MRVVINIKIRVMMTKAANTIHNVWYEQGTECRKHTTWPSFVACSNTRCGTGWPGKDVELGKGNESDKVEEMGGGPIATDQLLWVEWDRLALPVMVGLIVGKGIVEAILMSAAIQFNLSLLFKLSIFWQFLGF
jgi:hypothetical protein